MNKKIGIDDIPDDVLWVWSLKVADGYGNCIGVETYKKVQEVVKKYPEWFKEESKPGLKMIGTGSEAKDMWDMMKEPSHFLDHCYVKTEDGLKKKEWRDREKAAFDWMLKIMNKYEIKGRIRGRRREYLIVQARRYGFSEQLLMAQKKDREKKLNGRSWTRRYEREWLKNKAKEKPWYLIQQEMYAKSFLKQQRESMEEMDDMFTRYHEHLRQGLQSSE